MDAPDAPPEVTHQLILSGDGLPVIVYAVDIVAARSLHTMAGNMVVRDDTAILDKKLTALVPHTSGPLREALVELQHAINVGSQ